MAEKLTYKEAKQELEAIAQRIEKEEPDIDELSALIKRAKELVKFCKTKLKQTSKDIDDAIEELDHE